MQERGDHPPYLFLLCRPMAYEGALDGAVAKLSYGNAGLSRGEATAPSRVAHEDRRLRVLVDGVQLLDDDDVGRDGDQHVTYPIEER